MDVPIIAGLSNKALFIFLTSFVRRLIMLKTIALRGNVYLYDSMGKINSKQNRWPGVKT